MDQSDLADQSDRTDRTHQAHQADPGNPGDANHVLAKPEPGEACLGAKVLPPPRWAHIEGKQSKRQTFIGEDDEGHCLPARTPSAARPRSAGPGWQERGARAPEARAALA